MDWLKQGSEVKVPEDINKIVLDKFKKLVSRPWAKKVLDKSYLEKVLYNIVYKEVKVQNASATLTEIYKIVDAIIPQAEKVMAGGE